MKAYTIGKIFVLLSIPLILLTTNTFAENDEIENLHDETAILVSQERYNDALDIFDQILEIDPNNVKALINRSAVLITIGENEKGISDADKILTIEPNNIKALSNKATGLANIGYTYDAIATFEKGLEIDPNNTKLIDGRNNLFQIIDLFLLESENEKYEIHVQVQVRTNQDDLVSVIEGVQIQYLPFRFTDEFLNDYPIIDVVEKNGKDYEMRQIIHKTNVPNHIAYAHIQLDTLCKTVDGCVNLFTGKIPSLVVDNEEYLITQWTVYRLVE